MAHVAMRMPRRRVLASMNLAALLVLLGVLFIMANYVSSRRYGRWDVTTQQLASLSDLTRQTLERLEEPIEVIVFFQPTHRLHGLIRDLLEEYVREHPAIRVEYVDPEQDLARARRVVQELQIEELNLVVFRSAARQKYVSDVDLAEYDTRRVTFGGEPRVRAFKGEQAFTSAILSVTQAEQPLIWVTRGHGEKPVDSQELDGLSDLARYLGQQNMRVEPATLLEHDEIPGEVRLIIIPGPTRRFAEGEADLLDAYLARGGSLLALLDPLTDTALESLLREWGIQLGLDIVVDPSRRLPFVSAANLFVMTYTQHPVVEKIKTLMTLYPLARSVRPAAEPPEGVTVTPLALTSPQGWGEMQTDAQAFEFTDGEDLPGPVSIAVAAEAERPPRTRVIAVGDSDFAMNGQLANVGNRDLLLAATNWLIEQEHLIAIGPKALDAVTLKLTAGQLRGVFWFSFLGMPLVCGLLGVGMWWRRRQ